MTHFGVVAPTAAAFADVLMHRGITVVFDRTPDSEKRYEVLPQPVFVSDDGVIVLQLNRSVGRETTPDPEGTSRGARAAGLRPKRQLAGSTRS